MHTNYTNTHVGKKNVWCCDSTSHRQTRPIKSNLLIWCNTKVWNQSLTTDMTLKHLLHWNETTMRWTNSGCGGLCISHLGHQWCHTWSTLNWSCLDMTPRLENPNRITFTHCITFNIAKQVKRLKSQLRVRNVSHWCCQKVKIKGEFKRFYFNKSTKSTLSWA